MSSPAPAKVTGSGTAESPAIKSAEHSGLPQKPSSLPAGVVLMAAASGAGVLCGFLMFYFMYRSQCAALLLEKSVEFNATMERLQSVDDKKHIERQKHLLNQQTALTERHQNLLERLAESQNEQEATKRLLQQESETVKQLTTMMQQSEAALTQANVTATLKYERLQRQLELARTMLQEKVDEVEELKANVDDSSHCPTPDDSAATSDNSSNNNKSNDAYFQLQNAVRRQNAVQLGLLYGQPPYVVHLYLKSASQSAFSVELQISTLHEMPHAIVSFLSLIKAGMFLETSLGKSTDGNGGRLVGGNPSSSLRKQVQSKLSRRYAEQGYSSSALLLFTERSSKACQVGSLGWMRHGPSLVFHVRPESLGEDDDFTCFGRIVLGLDSLETFMASADERLSIVDARVVAAAAARHDEL